MTIRIHRITPLLLFLCSLAGAQSTDKTAPPSGVTVGIVEAVIGNGDLIPARFAKLYASSTDKAAAIKSQLEVVSDAIIELRSKAQNADDRSLVELACVQSLIKLRPLFEAAQKSSENVSTDADETGEFTLKGLLKQTYIVFAIGRVGMNAAFWLQDLAPSKQSDRLKLIKPKIACYDPNGYFKL